jgi:hypothetical protein
MNRISSGCFLLLAILVPTLNACGTQEQSHKPTEPVDTGTPIGESVSTLTINIGSRLGSPVLFSTTCNGSSESTPSCTYSDAPDITYIWTAPFSGDFKFTTQGSGFDTSLHIYNRVSGAALGCNDDAEGTVQSSLELSVSAGQQLRIVVDGYGWECGSFALNISALSGGPVKRAMTWSLLGLAAPNASQAYALVGTDAITNAYEGDTLTSQTLPVLCINKSGIPHPGTQVIGNPVQTSGGAWRRTWSGGTIALTRPVTGTSLTSRTVADTLCSNQFGTGYRMAEFHDGDPNLWSGWDFWGAARGANLTPFQSTRFWVAINGQNANPW